MYPWLHGRTNIILCKGQNENRDCSASTTEILHCIVLKAL